MALINCTDPSAGRIPAFAGLPTSVSALCHKCRVRLTEKGPGTGLSP